jgi:hypothetical protein
VPFLAGYISITGLDPAAMRVPLGAFQIVAGLYYRTPMPVQPMKAIGTAAISDAAERLLDRLPVATAVRIDRR